MDRFAQAPRAATEVAISIGRQTMHRMGPARLNLADAFPSTPGLNWLAGVWKWLSRWGQLTSVILGLFLGVKILFGLGGFVIRIFTMHRHHGCGRHLCAAGLPASIFWVVRDVFDRKKNPSAPAVEGQAGRPEEEAFLDPSSFASLNRMLNDMRGTVDRLDRLDIPGRLDRLDVADRLGRLPADATSALSDERRDAVRNVTAPPRPRQDK